MRNEQRVRALALDPRAPIGLKQIAENWLSRRADLVLHGQPEPALSELLQEHFDRKDHAALPPGLQWLRDGTDPAPDTTGPALEGGPMSWLNH